MQRIKWSNCWPSSSPSSLLSTNDLWTFCVLSGTEQNRTGKQCCRGNCLNMTTHPLPPGGFLWLGSGMPAQWVWLATHARTEQPSVVTICIAWEFLQGIHAPARGAVAFFLLFCTTERLSFLYVPVHLTCWQFIGTFGPGWRRSFLFLILTSCSQKGKSKGNSCQVGSAPEWRVAKIVSSVSKL